MQGSLQWRPSAVLGSSLEKPYIGHDRFDLPSLDFLTSPLHFSLVLPDRKLYKASTWLPEIKRYENIVLRALSRLQEELVETYACRGS